MEILLYILNLILIVGITYLIYQRSSGEPLRPYFIPIILLKIAAGIGLGWVYTTYYQWGDTISYYQEGVRMANLVHNSTYDYISEIFSSTIDVDSRFHNQPRALFISKITSIFMLLTHNSYWLTSIYFSLFVFACLWTLAKSLVRITGNYMAILISLFVFPSFVFWSSGLSKESIAIGAIALLIKLFIDQIYSKRGLKISQVIIFLIAFWLLWNLKYYYAGSFLVFSISGAIVYYTSNQWEWIRKKAWAQLILLGSMLMVATLILTTTQINFNLDRIAHVIYENNQAFMKKSADGDAIQFNELKPSLQSVFYHSPKALISGLFSPIPGNGSGLFAWIVKIENLILIFLSLTSLLVLFKLKLNHKNRIVIFSALGYCCFLSIFLSLSAPNYGTLSRYKVGFMPVFLLLITVPNPWIIKLNKWLFGE